MLEEYSLLAGWLELGFQPDDGPKVRIVTRQAGSVTLLVYTEEHILRQVTVKENAVRFADSPDRFYAKILSVGRPTEPPRHIVVIHYPFDELK